MHHKNIFLLTYAILKLHHLLSAILNLFSEGNAKDKESSIELVMWLQEATWSIKNKTALIQLLILLESFVSVEDLKLNSSIQF